MEARHGGSRRSRTTNGWFLVLLEIVVDKAQDERGLVRVTISRCQSLRQNRRLQWSGPTLPTAASPSSTSLTLLLGFGAAAAESVMMDML